MVGGRVCSVGKKEGETVQSVGRRVGLSIR